MQPLLPWNGKGISASMIGRNRRTNWHRNLLLQLGLAVVLSTYTGHLFKIMYDRRFGWLLSHQKLLIIFLSMFCWVFIRYLLASCNQLIWTMVEFTTNAANPARPRFDSMASGLDYRTINNSLVWRVWSGASSNVEGCAGLHFLSFSLLTKF